MPSEKLVYSTDSIAAAINNLKLPGTTATSADGGTIIICCPSRVTFEAVYDCATGEVIKWLGDDGSEYTPDNPPPAAGKWVDPPRKIVVRGSGGGKKKGIVTKDPPGGEWDPETYDGTDGNGNNLGEVIDWSEWSTTPVPHPSCDVANATVYAVEATLEEMNDSWKYIKDGVSALGTIFGQMGLLGGIFFLPGALAVLEIGIPTAIIIAILTTVNLLVDKFGGGLTNGFEDAREDLVCAIYGATSPKDLKLRWDAAVNAHWYVVQPQNSLVKYLMTWDLANLLMQQDLSIIEGTPKYGYDCGGCIVPTGIWTSTPVTIQPPQYWGGTDFHAIIWELPGATNSHLGWTATITATGQPANIFLPTGIAASTMIRTNAGLARLNGIGQWVWVAPQWNLAYPNPVTIGSGTSDNPLVSVVHWEEAFQIEVFE